MKSISLFTVAVLLAATSVFAQTKSYQALEDKFKGQPDVHSFSFSGWMGRLVLNMAGEHEFRNAIKELNHVRLITIPRSEFASQNLSVNGFRKLLKHDSFEELALIRDHGEIVSIYLREGNNNKNHYFVLVEEEKEVVAIELKGYIDHDMITQQNTTIAINK